MSVFFVPGASGDQQLTLEELHATAARVNMTIPAKDENDYLGLVRAADIAVKHVARLPAYVDPRLLPRWDSATATTTTATNKEDLAKARAVAKPSPEENPLGAWSHKCHIVRPSSSSSSSSGGGSSACVGSVIGPLAGRSVAVKDNVSVAGVPITLGTFPEFLSTEDEGDGGSGSGSGRDKASRYPVSEIDASVVTRVLEAGGTIAGTATCENYSASPLSYTSAAGRVDNPWGTGHATGGSSSGCASLVAASMKRKMGVDVETTWDSGIDLAIGGDQGGSIRVPAAYSGIYGLKPTHGLCPYSGIASLHPIIDHCGPMATSVEDVALLLSVMAGYDGLDPRMTPETPLREHVKNYPQLLAQRIQDKKAKGEWNAQQAGAGLKVGILKEGWAIPTLTDEVSAVTKAAAERFASLGAQVDEVSIPMHVDGPLIWVAATRYQMGGFGTANAAPSVLVPPLLALQPPALDQHWFDVMSVHNPAMVNVVLASEYLAHTYRPATFAKAHAHVLQLRAAYDAVLHGVGGYDVLVTPVTPTVAPLNPSLAQGPMEKVLVAAGNTANTCPFNATGHPALSMPVGWGVPDPRSEAKKMPVGMQIVGKRWDDETVLYAASVWEVAGLGLQS